MKNFLFKSASYATLGFWGTTYTIGMVKAHQENIEHAKHFPDAKLSSTILGRFFKTYYPFLLPKPQITDSLNNTPNSDNQPVAKK
jgi:hypothetical protein